MFAALWLMLITAAHGARLELASFAEDAFIWQEMNDPVKSCVE